MWLVEEALVPRRREGGRARGRDVVVVDVRVKVWITDVLGAEGLGCLAHAVDGAVIPLVRGVVRQAQVSAVFNLCKATRRAVEVFYDLIVARGIVRLDPIGVVVGHLRIARPLHESVHAPVDNKESVEVEDVRLVGLVPCSIEDALVLLLEIGRECGSIPASVRLGRDGYAVIIWLVPRKLLKPDLRKVPEGSCRVHGTLRRVIPILTRVRTDVKGIVLLRYSVGEVGHFDPRILSVRGYGNVGEFIVTEAHLHWLVEVQEVYFVVPGPLTQVRGVRVRVHIAGSVFAHQTEHGTATRATIHPNRERRILGVLARLEEPEEGVDVVGLIPHAEIVKGACREMDVTGIAAHAFRCFTDVILDQLSVAAFKHRTREIEVDLKNRAPLDMEGFLGPSTGDLPPCKISARLRQHGTLAQSGRWVSEEIEPWRESLKPQAPRKARSEKRALCPSTPIEGILVVEAYVASGLLSPLIRDILHP